MKKKPLFLEKIAYKNLIKILDGKEFLAFTDGVSFLDLIDVSHHSDCIKIKSKDRAASFTKFFIDRIDLFCFRCKSAKQKKLTWLIISDDNGFLTLFIL